MTRAVSFRGERQAIRAAVLCQLRVTLESSWIFKKTVCKEGFSRSGCWRYFNIAWDCVSVFLSVTFYVLHVCVCVCCVLFFFSCILFAHFSKPCKIPAAMGQKPVPPANIPIPTKIGSMGGEFTNPPKWDPKTVLSHSQTAIARKNWLDGTMDQTPGQKGWCLKRTMCEENGESNLRKVQAHCGIPLVLTHSHINLLLCC